MNGKPPAGKAVTEILKNYTAGRQGGRLGAGQPYRALTLPLPDT